MTAHPGGDRSHHAPSSSPAGSLIPLEAPLHIPSQRSLQASVRERPGAPSCQLQFQGLSQGRLFTTVPSLYYASRFCSVLSVMHNLSPRRSNKDRSEQEEVNYSPSPEGRGEGSLVVRNRSKGQVGGSDAPPTRGLRPPSPLPCWPLAPLPPQRTDGETETQRGPGAWPGSQVQGRAGQSPLPLPPRSVHVTARVGMCIRVSVCLCVWTGR